jgi:hypothetical protein
MGFKKLWSRDCMRTEFKIILALVLIIIGLIYIVQEFHVPKKENNYEYSSTDFIRPSQRFLNCFEDLDCIKIKGSACPPSAGGKEVCVDKDFFQEYLSEIEEKSGKESEIICPQVYLVTNKTCICNNGKCNLM